MKISMYQIITFCVLTSFKVAFNINADYCSITVVPANITNASVFTTNAHFQPVVNYALICAIHCPDGAVVTRDPSQISFSTGWWRSCWEWNSWCYWRWRYQICNVSTIMDFTKSFTPWILRTGGGENWGSPPSPRSSYCSQICFFLAHFNFKT